MIDRQASANQRESELRSILRENDPNFADNYDRFLKGDLEALGEDSRNASVELAIAIGMVESMMEVLCHVEDQGTLGNLVDLEGINEAAIGVMRGQEIVQSYIAPAVYAGLALGQM